MVRDLFCGTGSSFVADAEQEFKQHRIFRVSQSAGFTKEPVAEFAFHVASRAVRLFRRDPYEEDFPIIMS